MDTHLSSRLEYVQEATGKSTTEILRESLALYCDSLERRASPAAILRDTGFIGCGVKAVGARRARTGARAKSATYKDELTRVLEGKVARRR